MGEELDVTMQIKLVPIEIAFELFVVWFVFLAVWSQWHKTEVGDFRNGFTCYSSNRAVKVILGH